MRMIGLTQVVLEPDNFALSTLGKWDTESYEWDISLK